MPGRLAGRRFLSAPLASDILARLFRRQAPHEVRDKAVQCGLHMFYSERLDAWRDCTLNGADDDSLVSKIVLEPTLLSAVETLRKLERAKQSLQDTLWQCPIVGASVAAPQMRLLDVVALCPCPDDVHWAEALHNDLEARIGAQAVARARVRSLAASRW
jgi:hypothetical protein